MHKIIIVRDSHSSRCLEHESLIVMIKGSITYMWTCSHHTDTLISMAILYYSISNMYVCMHSYPVYYNNVSFSSICCVILLEASYVLNKSVRVSFIRRYWDSLHVKYSVTECHEHTWQSGWVAPANTRHRQCMYPFTLAKCIWLATLYST